MKVISGGQTGADLAGVIAAKKVGFETGGWMPLWFMNQNGNHPEYAEIFGMQEDSSPTYPPRTERNVLAADGTIRIATNFSSPGERLTLKLIKKHNKPHLDIHPYKTTVEDLVCWLEANAIQTLNVAGNSEKTSPGLQVYAADFLEKVFRRIHEQRTRLQK